MLKKYMLLQQNQRLQIVTKAINNIFDITYDN